MNKSKQKVQYLLDGLTDLHEIFRERSSPEVTSKCRIPEVKPENQDGGGRHLDFTKTLITRSNIDRFLRNFTGMLVTTRITGETRKRK